MLKFNSPIEQVCYITLSKDEAEQVIKNYSILLDKVLYEYKENLLRKENYTILEVVLDLSNMFDLTNRKDFDSVKNENFMRFMKTNNKKIIRYVELDPKTSVIYRMYYIKYRILDTSVIKKVSKV